MKLTVFQSDKGDCLLLKGLDGRNVLVDGGMRAAYSKHVASALGQMRMQGEVLDVVYLSHIDQDHIAGVLQLMDDEVAWRIHEYQIAHNNPKHKPPKTPRPPVVHEIWHNAFKEQLPKVDEDIEEMLAASAAILSGSDIESLKELAAAQNELVTSVEEAIKLTRRVGADQLGIRLNAPAKGKLMMARGGNADGVALGDMKFYIIGPFPKELTKLQECWKKWLKENEDKLAKIKARAEKEESQFSSNIESPLHWKTAQAAMLSEGLSLAKSKKSFKLGERDLVTPPNLASLMFFVEEQGKTLLLTGDGHCTDILQGLEQTQRVAKGAGIHVDVLKVQHHGSEHNLDEAFCKRVTADHYIFCGNGKHQNPDLRACLKSG